MLIDIAKIVIKDRIRQDYGNIEELASDISENGLINPPVVNKDYVLLAGERRLKACQMLGWRQIEVRMMDTRDAEHELNVEISENEVRKEFSKVERNDYMRRLWRIEEAKAKERQEASRFGGDAVRQKSDTPARADDTVSAQFGISRDTLRKENTIVNNKELLTPDEFADWDEGKLSTNKAFQKIIAAKDRRIAELESQKATGSTGSTFGDIGRLIAEKRRDEANQKIADAIEKGTVKVIEKEVLPSDYEEIKESLEKARYDAERAEKDYQKLREKFLQQQKENEDLQNIIGEDKRLGQVEASVMSFTNATNDYIRHYGGYVWVFSEFQRTRDETKADFVKSLKALDAFARQLITNLEGNLNG